MATGDLFRDSETGAIQRLVREDGDKMSLADPGREAEMYSMDREEFESRFEALDDLGDFKPVASSHSMSAETSRLERATREGDEEAAEAAAENIMLNNDASASELEETYVESEDQMLEDGEKPEGEFAPDLEAVEADLPESPADEDDDEADAGDDPDGAPGAGEIPAPATVTNPDQE